MSRRPWLPLALLVLTLAAGLRFYRIDAQSLWNDEALSLELAAEPVPVIPEKAARDIHPPLYYLLLKGWTAAAGEGELAARAFSAFASLLSIGVSIRLARDLLGDSGALVAGTLLALAPLDVRYAQEVRMYALLALESALLLFVALRLGLPSTHSPGRLWMAYGLIAVAILHTHYFGALILLGASVVLGASLLRSADSKISKMLKWVNTHTAVAVAYVPWLLMAAGSLETYRGSPPADQPWSYLVASVRTLLLGEQEPGPWRSLLLGMLVLTALATVILGSASGIQRGRVLFLAVVTLVPLAGFGVVSASRGSLPPRFLLPVVMPLVLLLAAGLRLRHRWLLLPVLGLLLSTEAQGVRRYYTDPSLARDDYRRVARWIQAWRQPGDGLVMFPSGHTALFYYLPEEPGDRQVYEEPLRAPLPAQEAVRILERAAAERRRLILVHLAPWWSDPDGTVARWLSLNTTPLAEERDRNLVWGLYASPGQMAWERVPVGARFGDLFELRELELAHPSGALALRMEWRALQPVERPYTVFLHLLDPSGRKVAQRDAWPGNGLLPTSGWAPGQPVRFTHGLAIPAGLQPGPYALLLGLYDAQSGERLEPTGVLGDPAPGGMRIPVQLSHPGAD